ncbi:hillarin [Aplysia californica]|uniref:Hillarin n=1 Tax=Aplysia californica TaxID=6500 RepID=A0ABM1VS55_APLCA|nr:hillarin [Aplysia californica]
MTVQFENEKKDLAATMRSKKEYRKKTMTLRLRQKEQQQTSELVKKQSQVMLEMLVKEQEELKAEITRELAAIPSQNGNDEPHVNGGDEIIEEVLDVLPVSVAAPPSPEAPALRKEELFTDESVFESIDEQVIKVAESEQLTYTDLVRQLTEDLVSDLEKAR